MKKIAFILLLFTSSLSWAQQFVLVDKLGKDDKKEEPKIVYVESEYRELLNHTPKSFVADNKTKPENNVLLGDLNSISSLELRFAYQEQLKLNETEIKWLENEISKLAAAFFNEGKPIIMQKTGDYISCTGQGIETTVKNKQKVTILHFCYTCNGAAVFEDRFLEVFNKKTESLIAAKKVIAAKKKTKSIKKKIIKK